MKAASMMLMLLGVVVNAQFKHLGCYQKTGWTHHNGNNSCKPNNPAGCVYYSGMRCHNLCSNYPNNTYRPKHCYEACKAMGFNAFSIEDGSACGCAMGQPTLNRLGDQCSPNLLGANLQGDVFIMEEEVLPFTHLGCYQKTGWTHHNGNASCKPEGPAGCVYYSGMRCHNLCSNYPNNTYRPKHCYEACKAMGFNAFSIEDGSACGCAMGQPTLNRVGDQCSSNLLGKNMHGDVFVMDPEEPEDYDADCSPALPANTPMSKKNKATCKAYDACKAVKKKDDSGNVVKVAVAATKAPRATCKNLAFVGTPGGTSLTDASCLASNDGCKACFLAEHAKDKTLNASFWNGEACYATTKEDAFKLTRPVESGSTICKFRTADKLKPVVDCVGVKCSDYTKPIQCTKKSNKEGISCFWNDDAKKCFKAKPEDKCNLSRRHCNKHPECKYYTKDKKCKEAVPEGGCGDYKKRMKCNNKSKGKCEWDHANLVCTDAGSVLGCERFTKKRACDNKSKNECGWNFETNKCAAIATLPGCEQFVQPEKCEKKSHGRCGWSWATVKCANKDAVVGYVCDATCCQISFKKLCNATSGCGWNGALMASLATKDPQRGSRSKGVCQKQPDGN